MKINLKLIILMSLLLIVFPKDILAHSAANGENNKSYQSCDGSYNWCLGGFGFRFSLYKYKGGNLTYYGSQDYESNYAAINGFSLLGGRNAIIMEASAGKVAYMNDKAKRKWSSQYYTLELKSKLNNKTLLCYLDDGCPEFRDGAKLQIENYFKLENMSDSGKTALINKLKKEFGKTISKSDLPYIYLTVEPTIYIYNKNKQSYYGTIYEIMYASYPKDGKSLYGIDDVIYQGLASSIYASSPTAVDINKFVSSKSSDKPKVLVVSDALPYTPNGYGIDWSTTKYPKSITARKINRNAIAGVDDNNKAIQPYGYGIAVFWLGQGIPVDEPSCQETCSAKTGNALLQCAEKYCSSKKYKTSTNKSDCIVRQCGYKKPDDLKCTTSSKPKTTTTKCAEDVSSSLTSCGVEPYFRTTCTETTTLEYPTLPKKNSLHVNDNYKASYSIKTTGTKTCKTEFNYKLFEFNYAIQVDSAERTKLKNILNGNYFKKIMHNNDLKYSVSGEAWGTKIFNNSSKNYTLNWKSKSYSEKLKSSEKKDITYYADGNKSTSASKLVSKTTVSANTGTLYHNSISYITNTNGKKNTKISIKRKSSGLDDTNTCSYKISKNIEELSCIGKILTAPSADGTYFGNVEIEYKITYKLNGEVGNYKDLKYAYKSNVIKQKLTNSTLKKTITITKKEGTAIKDKLFLEKTTDSDVSATCSVDIPTPSTPPPNNPLCSLDLDSNSVTKKVKVTSNKTEYNRPLKCEITNYDGTKKEVEISGNVEYFDYIGSGNKKLNLDESNPAVKVVCAFDLGDAEKEDCRKEKLVGSCNYIKKAKKDLVSDYCNQIETEDSTCFDNCTCPKWPNETEEKVNEWCRENWETEGYASETMCLKDCGKNQIQPSQYIFRPITLGKTDSNYNAFPNRNAGSNWTMSEFRTEENSFDKEKPLYTIILDSEKIRTIKNDGVSKTDGYIPYEKATGNSKLCFETKLLKDSKYRGIITAHENAWSGCE